MMSKFWNLLFGLVLCTILGCSLEQADYSLYRYPTLIPNSDKILASTASPNVDWRPEEIAILRNLWLGSLAPVPPDPSNSAAGDPRAAALGHRLFFDERLSANNQVACASCHRPDLFFTDGLSRSFGTRTTRRNALTIVGVVYSPWLLWDGHKDSLWAQAIEPIEHPDEQGYTRLHAVHLLHRDEAYRTAYEAIFDPLPELSNFDRFPDAGGPVALAGYRANWEGMSPEDQIIVTQIYANLGKAIAAYERLILPGPAPFDRYFQAILESDTALVGQSIGPEAVAGLRLFIGKAGCVRCHSGPLFTDHAFHNTGVPLAEDLRLDEGRAGGVLRLLEDTFNCSGPYSDSAVPDCRHLDGLDVANGNLVYAFKTPPLRNVAETGPYMHTGQFETLGEVLAHYSQAPTAPQGQSELIPLNLSQVELRQLESFLVSLSGPLATPPELLEPPPNSIP